MQARPFLLLPGSTLATLQAALESAVRVWAREWGVAADAVGVRASRAFEAAPADRSGAADWTLCSADASRAAWLSQPAELQGELQGLLFPRDANHAPQGPGAAALAPAGARRARLALQAVLAAAAVPGADAQSQQPLQPPASSWQRGQGAVQLDIAIGRQVLVLLLNQAACAALAGTPAPSLAKLDPVNRRLAVAPQPVTLELRIGAARVSLGSLMTLAVGDVIRLDTKVDQPVRMASAAGVPLFDAYLGRSGDQVAVEAVISHSSSFGAAA